MFDYAHIVAIEEHLRTRFPRGRVDSCVGTFERWGDAHEFRVESERRCYKLIVSHRFLSVLTPEPVKRLSQLDVAAVMRGAGVTAVSVGHDATVRLRTGSARSMTPEQQRRQRAERTAREIEAYVSKRAFSRAGTD